MLPVIVIEDFKTGDDDVFDREVIIGAIDGLYSNGKMVNCPAREIILFVPVHEVELAWGGIMYLIYWFEIKVNLVTGFPQTDTDKPFDELIGKPEP